MIKAGLWMWIGLVPVWAGEMPEKAGSYHEALTKRPESAALFERFRDAWLEERSGEDLEKELLARAEAGESGAWAILGRMHRVAGRDEAALKAFAKAKEQAPAAWLDLETAQLRLAAKDFQGAEKDALAVPEGDPLRSDALKLAGLACLRGDRVEEALVFWGKAVAAAPADTGLLEDLTELTRRESRVDLALEFCGKWRDGLDDAYGKAMATLRRSELLLAAQRFDEAMADLAEVLKVSADGSWLEREAMARAEQAHRQMGNTTGWAEWIGAQANEHPTRLNFHRAKSQSLAAAGKTDEALEILAEVLKRSPGDTAARWQRVDMLERSMKTAQAYQECAALAAEEKSETAGLRLAELAFRLEKKDEVKRALDGVLALADPAKRVGLIGLYARYGLPDVSERAWREAAAGEQGGQALRELVKLLRLAGRERDAIEAWKQLGARDVAQDRIEAAQMLAAAGERNAAREILLAGREKFRAEPAHEAALAEVALMDDKRDEAVAIFLGLARTAKRPDELTLALKGWLRASANAPDSIKDLGEETADRCLRAAWLAESSKPLPAVKEGDELERTMRLALLREHGRAADVVAMMDAAPGNRGPLFFSELADAKIAAGDLQGALAAARTWRERAQDQPGPWLREADILEKLGRLTEATVLLRRAAARFEDNEDAARRLFALLQTSADASEAMEWAWKRHDKSEDESARSTWLREILRVSKERQLLGDLKQRFEERARRDPASPGPLLALAELAKAGGDSREELDCMRRAAVNAPRDVAVVSALAALEERSGETARALERYAGLARLVPGHESARQLAQAKIRFGDIEGGMRDLQALAGEGGMDLRALEQSAGDLASRGYVGEAIRMLASVDPAKCDARLHFVLGMLLAIDGREREAVDHFEKVMTEPDDPAEASQRPVYVDRSGQPRRYLPVIQYQNSQESQVPGFFSSLSVPESLFSAKAVAKSQLVRHALRHGGEVWPKAVVLIPDLAAATHEQWCEVMDFVRRAENSNDPQWWDFMRKYPDHPLGVDLLLESGQFTNVTAEQVDSLLKRNPPLPQRMQLRIRSQPSAWQPDSLEFLQALDDATWRDETLRRQALGLVEWMFQFAISKDAKTPVTTDQCARGLALLEKAPFEEREAHRLVQLKARLAMLTEDTDAYVRWINTWDAAIRKNPADKTRIYAYGSPLEVFHQWRKTAGDKAATALIQKIHSPVLRCQMSLHLDPEQRIAMVKRELAALPADAPTEVRRDLIRMKWAYQQQGQSISKELREDLEKTAADESDPRMAMEAHVRLGRFNRPSQEERKLLEALMKRLESSPDAGDRNYAASYAVHLSGSFLGGPRTQARAVATRWGTSTQYYPKYSSGNQGIVPAIIAMEDRNQALREAAKLLESLSRSAGSRAEHLQEAIKSLSDAGLLNDALARVSLPANAGLGQQVAMIALLDACSKPEQARSLLAMIVEARPWETYWTMDLALRSSDDAETHRLLDRVGNQADFDGTMASRLMSARREDPLQAIARLDRLADWAAKAKASRGWIASVILMLAKGGNGGLQALTEKNEAQLTCYRRYLKLALEERDLAEFAFRVIYATRKLETPESLDTAARQALLCGAYTSTARNCNPRISQGGFNTLAAPAALEHLVRMAQDKGKEAAFPAGFLEQLQSTDPATREWLGRLFVATTVAELPDMSIDRSKTNNWVTLARHESAMLRASTMPGRDVWLTGILRENKYQYIASNLTLVTRQSLMDAVKNKALTKQLTTLMEAAAGPRKNWNKLAAQSVNLNNATDLILNAAAQSDAATLLAVLDYLREARVPVRNTDSAFSQLASWWKDEMQPPRNAAIANLLGNRRDAAYTIGVWQAPRVPGGEMTFLWGMPAILSRMQVSGQADLKKAITENPDAGFLELVHAWKYTNDKAIQRRALIKSAPGLAKLPTEIRRAVIDHLSTGLDVDEINGLPGPVVSRYHERQDAERKQRLVTSRQAFEQMKEGTSGFINQGYQVGSLIGPLIGDDDAFVAEVIAAWRPVADADKSGKEFDSFSGGLISSAGRQPKTAIGALRLLDTFWKGSPPPSKPNSSWGDPIAATCGNLGRQLNTNPEVWRQIATLSPKVQARFWLASINNINSDFGKDPELVSALREAAKGSELTRAALEWYLQSANQQRDSKVKIEAGALLGFAKAINETGIPAQNIATLVCRAYMSLHSFENAAAVMKETPSLLEGLKSFPNDSANYISQGILGMWNEAQEELRKTSGGRRESALPIPIHPVETAAALKFALQRSANSQGKRYAPEYMTPIILATSDAELLDLWIKTAGKSLVGDLTLILELLDRDRIAEAVALTPNPGRRFSTSRSFSVKMESLVAKLHKEPSPRAFSLLVQLSVMSDASDEEKPTEQNAERTARLKGEFERIRGTLTPLDRAACCEALGLTQMAAFEHVPALDEFADDAAAKMFRKSLLSENFSNPENSLFVAAVCSRVHAGDLSGLARLSAVFAAAPESAKYAISRIPFHRVQACLIAHANRHDAKLPEASVEAILSFAKALSKLKDPNDQSIASWLVHLAATDVAGLEAGLKDCGLEGVKPALVGNVTHGGNPEHNTLKAALRVALLHPVSGEPMMAWLATTSLMHNPGKHGMASLLSDPKLRAKISPTLFLRWNHNLRSISQEDMNALKLYNSERRADFNAAQQAEFDTLVKSLRIQQDTPRDTNNE